MLAPAVHAEPIVGLTSDNRLVSFDSLSPGTIITAATITGLQAGESLVGIDLRPRNGTIYGLGRTASGAGSIYTLAAGTGTATRIAGLTANPTDPTNPFTSLPGVGLRGRLQPRPRHRRRRDRVAPRDQRVGLQLPRQRQQRPGLHRHEPGLHRQHPRPPDHRRRLQQQRLRHNDDHAPRRRFRRPGHPGHLHLAQRRDVDRRLRHRAAVQHERPRRL